MLFCRWHFRCYSKATLQHRSVSTTTSDVANIFSRCSWASRVSKFAQKNTYRPFSYHSLSPKLPEKKHQTNRFGRRVDSRKKITSNTTTCKRDIQRFSYQHNYFPDYSAFQMSNKLTKRVFFGIFSSGQVSTNCQNSLTLQKKEIGISSLNQLLATLF